MTVGERIKMQRELKGMSQLELAKKIGYATKGTISPMVLGEDGMVLKETNKTPASVREIPIFILRLATLVKTAPDGFLCPYSVKGMENHLRRILRHSELPVSGFHMLRHSFASICYASGVADLACMKWGGWSDYRTMSQIYTHLAEKQEQADIEKLRNALAE